MKDEQNKPITINDYCGKVDGKILKTACCQKLGRYVTIQAKETNEVALKIGRILIKVSAPLCTDSEHHENLCDLLDLPEGFDENQFNQNRKNGSCDPAMTAETATTTIITPTNTTTQINATDDGK